MLILIIIRNILNAPVMRKINVSPGRVVIRSGFSSGHTVTHKFPSEVKWDGAVLNRPGIFSVWRACEKDPAQNGGQANEQFLHH
jgi:hypothetical protein